MGCYLSELAANIKGVGFYDAESKPSNVSRLNLSVKLTSMEDKESNKKPCREQGE